MSGERFRALVNKLSGRKGVTNPKALAAAIGRKKYGVKKFNSMAQAGQKRAQQNIGQDMLSRAGR